MNVVIYARYSSHNQNEQSIEGQLVECQKFCERNNYKIIGKYIDRAKSGTKDDREQFQQMIKDSEKGLFNGIVVYQLDRFARNRYDSAINTLALRNNGVKVVSATENISDKPEGRLVENVIIGVNEYYSADEYMIYSEDLEEMMDSLGSMIDIIEMVFAGIAGLSIVVGGIGIMNIMLVSVSERIKETGIRMALGAKNRDIIIQFLIEGIMITILSGIIGIMLASGATSIINLIVASFDYEFTLIINFMTMVKIILFCGIIGLIFGIYPAIKAGRLDPVEALKYE